MSNGCHPNCTEAAEKIQLQEQLAVAMQLIVAQQGEISRLKEEVKSGLHFVDWCRRNSGLERNSVGKLRS